MKSYGAFQIIAFILKLIGWLTIVFAVVVFFVGLSGPHLEGVPAVGALTALVTVISGIGVLATCESIQALTAFARRPPQSLNEIGPDL